MNDSVLEERIQKSLDEGFRKREIIKALKDDGYDEKRIKRIFRDLESGNDSSQPDTRDNSGPQNASQKGADEEENGNQDAALNQSGNSEELKPAGLGKRFGALLLDGTIILGLTIVMVLVLGQVIFTGVAAAGSGPSGGLISSILGGSIILLIFAPMIAFFLYYTLTEAYMSATPGKRLLGLKIVNDQGGNISGVQSLIRNVIRYIDILPSAYIIGVITILISDENKRLGDIAAGTKVVKE
jgi:uncharacterized RDD family membrane protein YckC